MWTQSCGPHNDDSVPSPVAGVTRGQDCKDLVVCGAGRNVPTLEVLVKDTLQR